MNRAGLKGQPRLLNGEHNMSKRNNRAGINTLRKFVTLVWGYIPSDHQYNQIWSVCHHSDQSHRGLVYWCRELFGQIAGSHDRCCILGKTQQHLKIPQNKTKWNKVSETKLHNTNPVTIQQSGTDGSIPADLSSWSLKSLTRVLKCS